ncbi:MULTISPECIES: hypothetical protein [unclassified Streptomyces]|uniref:hypothetical protein n=1 Tax=unclassified Streptomyces TaxID=2593676 RepID=UPI00363FAEBA
MLTERIESRFGMSVGQLRAAVTASPTAHPDATAVIRGHSLLVEAQAVLDRAEDDLLAALASQSGELDAATMSLAHRVDTAVTVRDGRAMTLRWHLDPDAPGKSGLAAQRLARFNRAGAPPRPAAAPAPRAGRALR